MKTFSLSRLLPAFALGISLGATLTLTAGCAGSGEPQNSAATANANAAAGRDRGNVQQVSSFGSAADDVVSFAGRALVRLDEIALAAGQRLVVTDGRGAKLLDVGSEANGRRPELLATGSSVRFVLSDGNGGYAATVRESGTGDPDDGGGTGDPDDGGGTGDPGDGGGAGGGTGDPDDGGGAGGGTGDPDDGDTITVHQVSSFGSAANDVVSFAGRARVQLDEIALAAGQRLVVTDGTGVKLLDVGGEANGQHPEFEAAGGSARFVLSDGDGGYAATVREGVTGDGASGGNVGQIACENLCRQGVQLTDCPPCP